MMHSKPKIACLGGGNAMPKAVLSGLKKYPVDISVICAMLDSGGSSGRLRKDYNILAPGDIRRAMMALADTSPVIEKLFNYRFEFGELAGHNLANLLITALELNTHNYDKTISEFKKILNVNHQILPVTLNKSEIWAELENKKVIKGESNIDIPKHNGNLKIKKVFLKPPASAYPKTIEAIKNADLIVIGPGDLYSTLAQILLVKGISQAILKSKGKTVYICNLMNKYGETNDFSVSNFSKQVEKWLKKELDFVLYNNFVPKKKRVKNYLSKHQELLGIVKTDKNCLKLKKKFIGKNLLYDRGAIEHDAQKVSKALISLL